MRAPAAAHPDPHGSARPVATQQAFSARKGSVPVRTDIDTRTLDACAQAGAAALRDAGRLVGNTELLLAPEQLTALERAVSDYWNRDIPVQTVQQTLAKILQDNTDNRRQP